MCMNALLHRVGLNEQLGDVGGCPVVCAHAAMPSTSVRQGDFFPAYCYQVLLDIF